MFASYRRVVELQNQLDQANRRLDQERQLHAEQLEALRTQAARYETMLIRVVDAALARHLLHSTELQPITPVVARPPQREDSSEPTAARSLKTYREIHFGGLDENAALLAIAKREEALIAAEEALALGNAAADDGDLPWTP